MTKPESRSNDLGPRPEFPKHESAAKSFTDGSASFEIHDSWVKDMGHGLTERKQSEGDMSDRF